MEFEQLGPYRIVRQLGAGGMGIIYEATHVESGQIAAVKVLASELAQRSGFRARFEIEIESLRKIEHENVVRIYGFGEQDGVLFYAMELIEGTNLEAELAQKKRYSWQEAIDIGQQLCRALKHAHDRGIIHRDLKPANVLVTPEGQIKLSDFGIARIFGNTGLTLAGGPIGTANYMSPEQAEGKLATPRSDLYSLGCLLYALVAGRPPFVSTSLPEMLHLQMTSLPDSVRKYAPHVPVELEVIIARLLEKDPGNRLPNAGVTLRSLQMVIRSQALLAEEQAQTDWFESKPPVSKPAATPSLPPDAPTLARTGTRGSDLASPELATVPGVSVKASVVTGASAPPSAQEKDEDVYELTGQAQGQANSSQVGGSGVRFITAEEAALQERKAEALEQSSTWVPVMGLLLLGLVVAGVIWYLLQPPSANRLYGRILATVEQAEKSDNPDLLIDAEDDIKRFMELYSADERVDELRNYQAEAEQRRFYRQARVRAKYLQLSSSQSPIERAYIEALSYAQLEPERGLARLNALLAVFSVDPRGDENTRLYLELSTRLRDQLSREIKQSQGEQFLMLRGRLQQAADIKETVPETSRSICQGIMELYGAKSWAEPLVEQARELLDTLGPATRPETLPSIGQSSSEDGN